jgi:hypothetical protein
MSFLELVEAYKDEAVETANQHQQRKIMVSILTS